MRAIATSAVDLSAPEHNLPTEDTLLRALVEGTATVTGDEFFRALALQLAVALDVTMAFVAEFAETKTRVRTLAFASEGSIVPNVEFDLTGTPCEKVVAGGLCLYSDHVAESFPADKPLAEKGIRSYLGVPLLDNNNDVLGHLAVCDRKAMPPEPRCLAIFKVFASRARAELERKRAERALVESEQRLATILASALDAIITVDAAGHIRLLNAAAESALGCRAAEAVGSPLARFLTGPFREFIDKTLPALTDKSQRRQQYIHAEEHFCARRMDGSEFPIEGTVSFGRANGEMLYTIILRDLNERREAEEKMHSLRLESRYLQDEIKAEYNFEEMVGQSAAFRRAVSDIARVAPTDAAVLITGETGTGKELVARAVHSLSRRKERPLIKVNCAALSVGLVESELFGHEKGAFTGALSRRIGRFELANGGTIFLDEIGDIPPEVQAKLLRVLQEREFERVGGTDTITTDVRVIAATNRNLAKAVQEGQFREDLYFRLNVVPIPLPPLRERRDDIPILARYFVTKYMNRMGKHFHEIDAGTMERLKNYAWPGNARELEHLVERAMILSCEPVLTVDESLLPATVPIEPHEQRGTLDEIERDHIVRTLAKTGWVIEGMKGAATALNMHPNTLRSRMKKLGIVRQTGRTVST
ncbi:MAG: sigma 54-interacting transcriptional regulator [Candidatus Hydrogenedentes bacterium]|nr:sigma 54-interacting transcriptional regulator [Candidatus Hydrogenedentota bacterium]